MDNQDIIMYDALDIQRIFKCGKNQAYALMNSNGFPSIHINKKILVEKQALAQWLKSRKGNIILI